MPEANLNQSPDNRVLGLAAALNLSLVDSGVSRWVSFHGFSETGRRGALKSFYNQGCRVELAAFEVRNRAEIVALMACGTEHDALKSRRTNPASASREARRSHGRQKTNPGGDRKPDERTQRITQKIAERTQPLTPKTHGTNPARLPNLVERTQPDPKTRRTNPARLKSRRTNPSFTRSSHKACSVGCMQSPWSESRPRAPNCRWHASRHRE